MLLVKLMSTFVVSSVVNKDASVAEATIAVLVVVLASFWIMVHACRHFHECGRSLGTLQSARKFLPLNLILSLSEVIGVADFATVDLRIDLTFSDLSRDLLILLLVIQSILGLFSIEESFCLLLVQLLKFFCISRAFEAIRQVLNLSIHELHARLILHGCAHLVDPDLIRFHFSLAERHACTFNLFLLLSLLGVILSDGHFLLDYFYSLAFFGHSPC